MTAMFSDADFPPLPSRNTYLISDTQSRVAKAEEALKKAIAEKEVVEKELYLMLAEFWSEQSDRQRKKRLTPRSQWRNPSDVMKLEAALYTMTKNDKEISALRLMHGIASPDDTPLLSGQTAEERNWHDWMYRMPDGFFNQNRGWEVEADEAWNTWLQHLDEGSRCVADK